MELILLHWLLGHTTNIVSSDQREERMFLLLLKPKASNLPLLESLYPPLLQVQCLPVLPSFYHVAWALTSANTLWRPSQSPVCPPWWCMAWTSPPSARNSVPQTQHISHRLNHHHQQPWPRNSFQSQTWRLPSSLWSPTRSGVRDHRSK